MQVFDYISESHNEERKYCPYRQIRKNCDGDTAACLKIAPCEHKKVVKNSDGDYTTICVVVKKEEKQDGKK